MECKVWLKDSYWYIDREDLKKCFDFFRNFGFLLRDGRSRSQKDTWILR